MLGSSPLMDLLGMVAGHAYYFLEDVYPRMTGRRLLKTPAIVRALFPAEAAIQARLAPMAAPAIGANGGGFAAAAAVPAAQEEQQQAAAAGGDADQRPHAD